MIELLWKRALEKRRQRAAKRTYERIYRRRVRTEIAMLRRARQLLEATCEKLTES